MNKSTDRDREWWLRSFGLALREIRDRNGYSQEKLAFRCGLDRTYVSAVERGARNPTVQVIWRLAAGLETTVDELLRTAEEIRRDKR